MSAGTLPEGWAEVPVSSVASLIRGVTYKKEQAINYRKDDYLPLIRANNIQNGKFDTTDLVFVPKNLVKESQQISPEDIVIAMSSGSKSVVGKSAHQHLPFECSFGAFCGVLRPEKLIFPSFIAHFTKSSFYRNKISSLSAGANINNIKPASFDLIKIPIPSLAEQKIIAEKLDTLLAQVDTAKARLEQIPQILKRFRQAVLAMAISGKLTEEWRRNSNTDLSKWVNSNIGELAQVATGKTPKRTEITYWENGSIPWLTSSSTGRAYVDTAEQFITLVALKECTLKIFPPGTLLLAMYGEGKTRGQVTELKISATCNQACAAIICNKEKIDLQFLKMRLMENYEETRKAAAGGNQPNLNLNKVREIPVLVPPQTEQKEIVRRVEQLFAYADTVEKQVHSALTRVNNLTQSILAKAFRGELTAQWRVENPDLISGENSAAALLEKIKVERAASGSKKVSRKKK
ncbi:restriction endonuclease subunit S [Moellerella wisconsensis]|uniref:restriction endonuclease subunit S n=1 Tax=Moellerella wisconsensis TaxID=158849 RepID=UPI0030761EF0